MFQDTKYSGTSIYEVPRDWGNWLVISRFRGIHFTVTLAGLKLKYRSLYLGLRYIEVREVEVPLYGVPRLHKDGFLLRESRDLFAISVLNGTPLLFSLQIVQRIEGIDDKDKELVTKYKKEMALRKKLHNELVELKGNIRVYCRVRPVIKEDGGGKMAANVVSFDEDDDGVLGVFSKGSTKLFEMDKVFTSESTQQQVIVFLLCQ